MRTATGPPFPIRPHRCTGMIARVREVTLPAGVFVVQVQGGRALSVNTGVAPSATMGAAVMMTVSAGTRTRRLADPQASSAACSAAVPEATATACGTPNPRPVPAPVARRADRRLGRASARALRRPDPRAAVRRWGPGRVSQGSLPVQQPRHVRTRGHMFTQSRVNREQSRMHASRRTRAKASPSRMVVVARARWLRSGDRTGSPRPNRQAG